MSPNPGPEKGPKTSPKKAKSESPNRTGPSPNRTGPNTRSESDSRTSSWKSESPRVGPGGKVGSESDPPPSAKGKRWKLMQHQWGINGELIEINGNPLISNAIEYDLLN